MRVKPRRRKSVAFFVTLGACLVALAVALSVGWIILNWTQVALLVLGIVFFNLLIFGLIVNTTFLIREIRRNEQHDAFINAVTHELKTPVASIRLYLETLKTRDVDAQQRQEFYDIMLADSDRLLKTVEQVLQASRAGEKATELHRTEFDIRELMSDVIQTTLLRRYLDESAIRTTFPSEPVEISADREALTTVVSNLLDNAMKYSENELKITVETFMHNNHTLGIKVQDNGIGMSKETQSRIFEKFYRAHTGNIHNVKGFGLGLSYVKTMVEAHGGEIKVDSILGKGSTFTMEFPLKKLQRQPVMSPVPA